MSQLSCDASNICAFCNRRPGDQRVSARHGPNPRLPYIEIRVVKKCVVSSSDCIFFLQPKGCKAHTRKTILGPLWPKMPLIGEENVLGSGAKTTCLQH